MFGSLARLWLDEHYPTPQPRRRVFREGGRPGRQGQGPVPMETAGWGLPCDLRRPACRIDPGGEVEGIGSEIAFRSEDVTARICNGEGARTARVTIDWSRQDRPRFARRAPMSLCPLSPPPKSESPCRSFLPSSLGSPFRNLDNHSDASRR